MPVPFVYISLHMPNDLPNGLDSFANSWIQLLQMLYGSWNRHLAEWCTAKAINTVNLWSFIFNLVRELLQSSCTPCRTNSVSVFRILCPESSNFEFWEHFWTFLQNTFHCPDLGNRIWIQHFGKNILLTTSPILPQYVPFSMTKNFDACAGQQRELIHNEIEDAEMLFVSTFTCLEVPLQISILFHLNAVEFRWF